MLRATRLIVEHEQLDVLQPVLDLDAGLARRSSALQLMRNPAFPGGNLGLIDFADGKQRVKQINEVSTGSWLEFRHLNPNKVTNFMTQAINAGK